MGAVPSQGDARERIDPSLQVRIAAPRRDLDPAGPSVSVVIPAMNEAQNLPWLAARMPAGVTEIILVDGRSTDDTVEVARRCLPAVRIVEQNRSGKGNALACGFEAARGDIIVMIDADGSMDPGEIPYFVDALVAGADYAKGSRFASGGGSCDITRFRRYGNHVLNAMTAVVHRTSYTDLCYGYNAFWRRILGVLALEVGGPGERRWGDGFEIESMINIRVHSAGLRITEVPSYESNRLYGVSNLNAIQDGWRVLSIIARESRSLRHAPTVHGSVVERLIDDGPSTAPQPVRTRRRAVSRSPSTSDDPLVRLEAELVQTVAVDLEDEDLPGRVIRRSRVH